MRRALFCLSWLGAAVALSCGDGGHALDGGRPRDARGVDAGATAMAIAPAASPPLPVASADDGLRPVYDLAAHLADAHLRSGGLLVDLGTSARDKATLGDWKSGWRGNYREGETTFSYVSGFNTKVRLQLLPEEAGGGVLTIRGRAHGSTRGRIYLNGVDVGGVELPRGEFGYAEVRFATGLVAGTNEVVLRFNEKTRVPDGGQATIAVDFLRLTPEGAERPQPASAFDAVRLPGGEGRPDGILLAEGESLLWNLPLPAGVRLRGRLGAREGGATLRVRALHDSGAPLVLGEVSSDEGRDFDLDLGPASGKPAALILEATRGELVLSGARLHVPRGEGRAVGGRREARNVIWLVVDTLRADRVKTINPSTRVTTPSFDRLGQESAVFVNALCQENWTKPSVATLLSGLYPASHGAKSETATIPRDVTLLSEHLGPLGFVTAGLSANGYVSGKFGFDQGFASFTNYVREGKPNRAQFVFDDAIAWLGKRPADKPFFLFIQTIDPHVPYMPPASFRALYDDDRYDGPIEGTQTAKQLEAVKLGQLKLTDRDRERVKALYDGEISYHDFHFARFLDALVALGLAEDTLLVVTADHGEEQFERGSVGHGHSMYEELLHVPLVIRLPGAKAGEGVRLESEAGLVDLLPTTCAVLGVEPPAGLQGRSLLPLLAGEGESLDEWPRASFSDFLDGHRVARLRTLKLWWKGAEPRVFDLAVDPGEKRNVIAERPVTYALLADLLGRHEGRFVPTVAADGRVQRTTRQETKVKIDPTTRDQLEALGYMGR